MPSPLARPSRVHDDRDTLIAQIRQAEAALEAAMRELNFALRDVSVPLRAFGVMNARVQRQRMRLKVMYEQLQRSPAGH